MQKQFIFILFIVAFFSGANQPIYAESIAHETRLIFSPQPFYPPKARFKEISGFVETSIEFNQDGEVIDIDIINSKNIEYFEQAVLYTLASWKVEPNKKGRTILYRTFNFTIAASNAGINKENQEYIHIDSNENHEKYLPGHKYYKSLKKDYKLYLTRKHNS